jgi:hypothetical protein
MVAAKTDAMAGWSPKVRPVFESEVGDSTILRESSELTVRLERGKPRLAELRKRR